MKRRPWTISRRLTVWFAITTASLVLTISLLSAWFVDRSIHRELEALVIEEHDEFRAYLAETTVRREDVKELTDRLAMEHPDHRLAWRIWETNGSVWGDFGAKALLADVTLDPRRSGSIFTPAPGRRWSVERLDLEPRLQHEAQGTALLVGLLVDGRRQLALVRTSGLQVFGLLVLAATLATVSGALFGRRVSNLLRDVAQGVRSQRDPSGPVDVDLESAPEEIREVADALAELLRKIRDEADRARLMTAGLAHELRSPIQNLLGETEVALLRERDAADYRAVLESHVEELRDLGRVVDNLVTLCAGEPRPGDSELEVFDLGREAALRLQKERNAAERAGIDFALSEHGDLSLRGDREALLLALRNLVGNALQWAPAGSRVSISLEGGEEMVTVTVQDEGPGVPDSERERVFEPFYSASSKNGRRVGFGLGLALVRKAVNAQKGTVELERSPSGGASFRVRLPRGLALGGA